MVVKAIPDGYENIPPHLVVKDAAKSIDFYKKVFGAEESVPQHNSWRRKQTYPLSANNKDIKNHDSR
jgi:uncharacterized glyoxalase superfamily protein PhnB